MLKKSVSVIGLGYIGLPTAAVLAESGYTVSGIDIDGRVVDTINNGEIHIVEPDLAGLVRATVHSGRLRAFVKPQLSDVYILCVPTPFDEKDDIPSPDLTYLITATLSIASMLKAGDIIIIESTSPVGTTERLQATLIANGVDISQISIAYCPERVLPGKILKELVSNDRVVGGISPESAKAAADFYRSFVNGSVFETDAKSAEMCKLVENSYRDVNIAFANELSILCENEGVDVWKVIELANRHPRVNILRPGAGVGGHCIAVDPWFLVSRDVANAKLIKTAREVNDHKAHWVVDKISARLERLGANRVACFGLAFKPDIDDLRESPALSVALGLIHKGYQVIAVEPNIEEHQILKLHSLADVFGEIEVVAILVGHKEFYEPDILLKLKQIDAMDFCGVLS